MTTSLCRTSDAVFSDCDREYVNYYNSEVLPTSYVKFERFATELNGRYLKGPSGTSGIFRDSNYGVNY